MNKTEIILEKLNEISNSIKELISKIDFMCSLISQKPNPVLLLLQEYFTYRDLDGDGLIYGKDFYISDPPEILRMLPIKGVKNVITWKDYQSSREGFE